jgi:hypothetical protein
MATGRDDGGRRAIVGDRAVPAAAGPTTIAPPAGDRVAGAPDGVVAETARRLFGTGDPEEGLARVVRLAHALVPGCVAASVTLTSGGSTATVAASDPLAADLDAVQHALRSGPGLRVVEPGAPAWVGTDDEGCWAGFAARARALGVACSLSHGLVTYDGGVEARLGSLNLYGRRPAFGDEAREVAQLLAAHVTVIVAAQHPRSLRDLRQRRVRAAVGARDAVGRATGLLVERQDLSHDEALGVLRRAAQVTGTRLHDAAARLLDGADPLP